jgi:hypothetical protein
MWFPAFSQVTDIMGGSVNSDARELICSSGDLELALIGSTQDTLGTESWTDNACLIGQGICFISENRRAFVIDSVFPLGDFVNFQFNVHRINSNTLLYDDKVVASNSSMQFETGDICTNAGSDISCMTPSAIFKSDTDLVVFPVDGLVAQLGNRGGACIVVANPGQIATQCVNVAFGLSINDGAYVVDEIDQKLYVFDYQPGSIDVDRLSFTATTITDDALTASITGTGTPVTTPRSVAIDNDGLIYISGFLDSGDSVVDTINQDLTASATTWTTTTGAVTSLFFDQTESEVYVCGLTRVEKYSITGTLLATSGSIGCNDVAVDDINGQVYVVSTSGNIISLDPDDLTQDHILLLTAASADLAGLEIDAPNRRAYTVNVGSGADERTFYSVSTCSS